MGDPRGSQNNLTSLHEINESHNFAYQEFTVFGCGRFSVPVRGKDGPGVGQRPGPSTSFSGLSRLLALV